MGSSWGVLGCLRQSWRRLGLSWAVLEASWKRLGRLLARLGPSWRRLGRLLRRLGGVLGASWKRLELDFNINIEK